jgi:hypothetical protein
MVRTTYLALRIEISSPHTRGGGPERVYFAVPLVVNGKSKRFYRAEVVV